MFCDTCLTFVTVPHRIRAVMMTYDETNADMWRVFCFLIVEQELRAVTEDLWWILKFHHRSGLFNDEFLKCQAQNVIGAPISTSETKWACKMWGQLAHCLAFGIQSAGENLDTNYLFCCLMFTKMWTLFFFLEQIIVDAFVRSWRYKLFFLKCRH